MKVVWPAFCRCWIKHGTNTAIGRFDMFGVFSARKVPFYTAGSISCEAWRQSLVPNCLCARSDSDDSRRNYDRIRRTEMFVSAEIRPSGAAISHPGIRVKHCAYGHSVTTLLNPRGVTTVSHKYSLQLQDIQLWLFLLPYATPLIK
jgi:hypothetical protein